MTPEKPLYLLKEAHKFLAPSINKFRWVIGASILIACVLAALNFINLHIVRGVFNERFFFQQLQVLIPPLVLICSVIFVGIILSFILALMNNAMLLTINRDLIDDFYKRTCGMPILFFSQHSPGKLMTLLLSDITQVTQLIPLLLIDVIKNLIIISVIGVYMISINWLLALMPVVLLILYGYFTYAYNRRINAIIPRVQKTKETLNTKLIEYFQGINLLKVYDLNDYEKNKVHDINNTLADQNKEIIKLETIRKHLVDSIVVLLTGVYIVIGYHLINRGVIAAGNFIVLLVATGMLNGYCKSIFSIFSQTQQALVNMDRLDRAFKQQEKGFVYHPITTNAPAAIQGPINSILFSNVSFTFDKEVILHKINCSFEKGRMYGITGESGFGKTTLLNLLLQLLSPTEGDITVNGVSLKNIDHAHYLNHLSYLPQRSFLFSGTFKENIALGVRAVDDEKMKQSSVTAQIHDFIMKQSSGYDTNIHTGVVSISEGEKKRVELARALYKDSSVFVFDEPTVHLDLHNKITIIEKIKNLKKHIVIVVSHDLSMLEQCNTIIHINKQKELDIYTSYSSFCSQVTHLHDGQ